MKNIHMREKVQHKLNSMASILIDDIVIPGQEAQQGSETVTGSYYDEKGNKFTFTLSLVVTPEEVPEEEEPVLGIPEQIALILEKLNTIESEVATLKAYHSTVDEPQTSEEVTQNEPNEGNNTND